MESCSYDVVILGGAIAGASMALLLRRRMPHLRVLIIEKKTEFDWKVGESTVEVSSYFFVRELRLHDYLVREHLTKQSFRFWFFNGDVRSVREASESGMYQLARSPAFQLDRAKLDEHVLKLAADEGAELWRPARVLSFELADENGSNNNKLIVERDGARVEISARWLVDASGRSAMIARKKGMLQPLREHPIAAIWARFRGVKDFESPDICGHDPSDPFLRSTIASRKLATNHFVGWGYWIWFIPLHGGEMSIGLVYDQRLVEPPGANPREKLMRFLEGNPLTKQLIAGAEMVEGDLRQFGHLPYLVDKQAGVGWSLVGDAAGFLDPFYSPGLDQMAFSARWTLELIRNREKMKADEFVEFVEKHNRAYARYFRYFFESIYRDKYYLMGDYDTMTAAFLMDTSLYFIAEAIPLYRQTADWMLVPPYYPEKSGWAMKLVRFYQRRLIHIAQRKKQLGIYGNHNAGRRPRLVGFSLRAGIWLMLARGMEHWFRAEAQNALTYLWRPRPMTVAMPVPAAPTQPDRELADPTEITAS